MDDVQRYLIEAAVTSGSAFGGVRFALSFMAAEYRAGIAEAKASAARAHDRIDALLTKPPARV